MNSNEYNKLMKTSHKSFTNLCNAHVLGENSATMGMFFKIRDNEAIFISISHIGAVGNKIIIEEMHDYEPNWDPIITHECEIKNVVVPKNFVDDTNVRHIGWYRCYLLKIEKTHTEYLTQQDVILKDIEEILKN